MLRNPPRLAYCGLTVILSNPSRFDKSSLLTASGGVVFNAHCLRPEFNVLMCDVRLADDTIPFLPNTKCVLLLGEYAMHKYVPDTRGNTLNEMRGSPLSVNGIPAIASYFPQDCCDRTNHEQTLNEESKEFNADGEVSAEDEDEGDVKRFSATKRSNYAFWLQKDVAKCKAILLGKVASQYGSSSAPIYHVYPPADVVVNVLSKASGQWMDFDIETDYEEQNLLCFAFSFDGVNVYSVPVLNHEYQWAYSSLPSIIKALAKACRDNTVVAHNGASFDFFVLASKYSICVRHPYDTMLAMHRCYPDVEKSLGHCTSLWTWERFHKDSDSQAYRTQQHMMDKLRYCAKDVYTMSLIRKAITDFSSKIPGLPESIKCAQDSIKPYLTATLQGIRFDPVALDKVKKENDRLMMHYIRLINILIGDTGLADIKKIVKKAKSFPGSNKQCVKYFHDLLGYDVVARSPQTGEPSLGKKAMYKLALKYPNNPVIVFTLLYRQVQKEYGSLKFNPFKDDNNQIIKYDNHSQESISSTQALFDLARNRFTKANAP